MNVTLLTPTHPPTAEHLPELAESVAATQRTCARHDIEVRWVVVVDGPGDIPDVTDGAHVIRRPLNGGVSAARNTGLVACADGWVMPLDHDDAVDADELVGVVTDPRVTDVPWVGAHRQPLNGSAADVVAGSERRWEPRDLEAAWGDQDTLPFHPNALLVKRDAALAVGGWPALTGAQDLGLIFELNRRWAGWSLAAAPLRYRRWRHQTVSQPTYPRTYHADVAFLRERVNADRRLAGFPPVTAPPDPSPLQETA